jgi:8-oxo-dGTP diphosphatase
MPAAEQGAAQIDGRWLTQNRTLCFIRNGDDVLLLKRSAHKRIFPNRYNGVGGHIERGEDPLTGARREILEETGLHIHDLKLCAIYSVDAGADVGITVYAFVGECAERTVIDSDEGTLEWVPLAELDRRDLVDDLPLVLPRLLAMQAGDAPIFVQMRYNERDEMVVSIVE